MLEVVGQVIDEVMGRLAEEVAGAAEGAVMEDTELFGAIKHLYEAAAARAAAPRVECRRERIEWTEDHDKEIIEAMRVHGISWRAISRETGFGSEDAIRNRVLRMEPSKIPRRLRAAIRRRPLAERHERKRNSTRGQTSYSVQEDAVIWSELERAELGAKPSWRRLAKTVLTNRTSQSIRNRAYRLLSTRDRLAAVNGK